MSFSISASQEILRDCRYLLHDRDTKYTKSFQAIIASGRVEPLVLPARSPNLNAYAERWVRSVKEECLSKVIFFGERSLRRAVSEYVEHYHTERNHQGKGNVLLFPRDTNFHRGRPVQCSERWVGCFAIIIKRRLNRAPMIHFRTLTLRSPDCGRSRHFATHCSIVPTLAHWQARWPYDLI
jgi:hypothetical protein